MSAPAPGLTTPPKPIVMVKVRLGDAANAATCVSLIFSLLVVVLPESFPNVVIQNGLNGHLAAGVLLFAMSFNCAIYLRIAKQRCAKADARVLLALGFITALTVIAFSFILPVAVLMTQWQSQARMREEVLALVYFAVLSAVLFPFLVIRFTQDRKGEVSKATESLPQ